MCTVAQIAYEDLTIQRLHLLLHFPTIQGELIIESVVIVRFFGKGRRHLLSLGEFVYLDCLGIGLESLIIGKLAVLVVD